jgi:hypothetical protein
VRWDDLFGDLEAQLAAADAADLAADADQRLRLEVGRTTVVGRLRAAVGHDVAVGVGDQVIRGRVEGVGPDWLLLGGDEAETLLPLAAVGWLQGLGRLSEVGDPGRVWSRLGLRFALRGLARDRVEVRLHAAGPPVAGTIDRVGDDHLDLAVHPPGEPRRAAAVTAVRTVPLAAIRAVVRGTVA